MKKITALLLVCGIIFLIAPKPDVYKAYIKTEKPVGEVVFHLEGDSEFYCICEQEEIPEDALLLDKIYSGSDPGLFHTCSEIEQELRELADEFPEKCELRIVGSTLEGRPIHALRLYPGKPSPGFLFIGTHHAREWMSAEVPLELCHYLTKNPDDDPRVSEWLANFDIWIIPMLNPDGHQYSVDHDRMWRKNRKPGKTELGVDLNRNYSYHWGGSGSSGDPSSQVYRGKKAFSELETQIIKKLTAEFPMLGCLTYHTYGDLVLYPWSYADERAPWENIMEELAIGLASKTGPPDDNDNKKKSYLPFADKFDYIPIKASELYTASGECCDYLYSEHGTAAFTIEIGDKATGFTPDEDKIQPTIDQILDLNFFMLDEIPKKFCIVEGFVKTAIGTVPDAKILLGKSFFEIKPDPFTGYFFRIIPKGKHLLKVKWSEEDNLREMVEFTEDMNRLDLTWIRENDLILKGIITDEVGNKSSTTLTLVNTDGEIVSSGFFDGEFTFSNLTKDKYFLHINQFEMNPEILEISLNWDLNLNVITKGSSGF